MGERVKATFETPNLPEAPNNQLAENLLQRVRQSFYTKCRRVQK